MTPFAAMIVATGTGSEAAPPPLPPPSPAMLLLVLLLSLGIQPAMSARNSAAHHSEIIESIDGTASDATTHSPPRPPPPPGLPLALLPVLLVRLMVRVLLALLLKERVRMGEAVTSCGHKNALPFQSPYYLHNISMCSSRACLGKRQLSTTEKWRGVPLFAPYIYTMHHFTKTGSGQT